MSSSVSDAEVTVGQAPGAEVPDVLATARRAAAWWRTLSVTERADRLLRFRRALIDRLDELVATVGREVNKPRIDAINEVIQAGRLIGYYAKHGRKILQPRRLIPSLLWNKRATIHYRPLGVVGCITPWNYPVALALSSAVPALLAGNAVILKPSRRVFQTEEAEVADLRVVKVPIKPRWAGSDPGQVCFLAARSPTFAVNRTASSAMAMAPVPRRAGGSRAAAVHVSC